jgi:hypothetical protein
MGRRLKKSVNKKVRNATKVTYDNITFRSKLEFYCYKQLKANQIPFKYEEITFTLLDAFTFDNLCYEVVKSKKQFIEASNKIRPITYTPDFVGNNWIIETKGNPNDSWPLRWKLFKKYLVDNNFKYSIFVPKNQKQVNETINIIKNGI